MDMTENSFWQRIKRLKVDLKGMTWKEKIDHIWTYYRQFIFFTAVGLIVIIGVGSTILAPKKELLMGGMCVNTYISEEGTSYLMEELFDQLQGDPKKQETQMYFRSFGDMTTSTQDYETFQSIVTMLYAKKLDYLLMDADSLAPIIGYDSLLDLREVFTAEELEQFGEKIQYAQAADDEGNPTGEKIPVAVEITDISFIQDCKLYNQKFFLGFATNAPNKDSLREFWQYLLAWEDKT